MNNCWPGPQQMVPVFHSAAGPPAKGLYKGLVGTELICNCGFGPPEVWRPERERGEEEEGRILKQFISHVGRGG